MRPDGVQRTQDQQGQAVLICPDFFPIAEHLSRAFLVDCSSSLCIKNTLDTSKHLLHESSDFASFGELSSSSLSNGLHLVHMMALWGTEPSVLPVFGLFLSRTATSAHHPRLSSSFYFFVIFLRALHTWIWYQKRGQFHVQAAPSRTHSAPQSAHWTLTNARRNSTNSSGTRNSDVSY